MISLNFFSLKPNHCFCFLFFFETATLFKTNDAYICMYIYTFFIEHVHMSKESSRAASWVEMRNFWEIFKWAKKEWGKKEWGRKNIKLTSLNDWALIAMSCSMSLSKFWVLNKPCFRHPFYLTGFLHLTRFWNSA